MANYFQITISELFILLENYEKMCDFIDSKFGVDEATFLQILKTNPGPGIPNLSALWKTERELQNWLNTYKDDAFSEDNYWNLKAPIRLIQTHMPSSRTDKLGIKSTGPLNTDFNILCVDLFLRTGKHEFVFANSMELNHQAKAPNHLQQNYTIDILVAKDGFKRHKLLAPWYDNLTDCINNSSPKPRKIDKTQLDFR